MSDKFQNHKKELETYGKRIRGNSELIKHFAQQRLTSREAIFAKCYDCMGYYYDGKSDCKVEACPLYPYNPFGAFKGRGIAAAKKIDT